MFNSKINLPKFCTKLGYTGYSFIKLPTFGWFAYNRDKTFVANVFDLVSQKDKEYLYSVVCRDKPEYLDFELAYSDLQETRLKYNLFEIQLWHSAFAFAQKEMLNYKTVYGNKRVFLKDVLVENGFSAALQNNIGVITQAVLDKYQMLPWPKKPLRGKILLPSWSTPQHICSLETCDWDTPDKRTLLWMNGERGWYGNLNAGRVLSNVNEVWTTPGFTWDYKADYWMPDRVIDVSDNIDTPGLLKLWAEAKNTSFSEDPLTKIIDRGDVDELRNHISNLSFTQLQEIEKATGKPMLDYWKRSREAQVIVGTRTYVKRGDGYWLHRKKDLIQVTNFALDIERIIKKDGTFYRKGNILFNQKVVPFEMEEKFFTTHHLFQRGIKEKFLSLGLGVPTVHPNEAQFILILIDSFNPNVLVEVDEISTTN